MASQKNGPPPPPHSENPKSSYGNSSNLPPGNYDIFIIPPHSSGGGFVYLPSLKPQMNSFFAGVACTILALLAWKSVEPVLSTWVYAISRSNGLGGMMTMATLCGLAGWFYAKTVDGSNPFTNTKTQPNSPNSGKPPNDHQYHSNTSSNTSSNSNPHPNSNSNTHTPNFGASQNGGGTSSAWEKAKEDTQRRNEERRRAEEAKRQADEAAKRTAEFERQARAAAEKVKWEQARAREKEQKEREERERVAREKMASTQAKQAREREELLKAAQERGEKLRRERAETEKAASERAKSEKTNPTYGVGERTSLYGSPVAAQAKSTIGVDTSPKKAYVYPTAHSYVGTTTENTYRPFDSPKNKRSNGSMSEHSDESKGSDSTVPGPYSTNDEKKVIIKGAFKYTDSFPKPVATVKPNESGISDGLIMRMDTAGVFLDDDKKKEPLRQWDIKAWTMKSVETSQKSGLYIIRVSVRDQDNTKFVYYIPDTEDWKVPIAIKRLKSGMQAKTLPFTALSMAECNKLMGHANISL